MKIRSNHYSFSLLALSILQNIDKFAVSERIQRCVGPDLHATLQLEYIWKFVENVLFWVLGRLLWVYQILAHFYDVIVEVDMTLGYFEKTRFKSANHFGASYNNFDYFFLFFRVEKHYWVGDTVTLGVRPLFYQNQNLIGNLVEIYCFYFVKVVWVSLQNRLKLEWAELGLELHNSLLYQLARVLRIIVIL